MGRNARSRTIRSVSAATVLVVLVVACGSPDATGPNSPGGGSQVTVSDAPPGPAWSGSAIAVTVGTRANCLLNTDNTAWCWGNTRGGDLRIDIGLRNVPRSANSETVIDSICVAKRTGGVGNPVGWPCNVFAPIRLSTRPFSSITLGMREQPPCAIDAGGTPFCWDQSPLTSVTPDSVTNGGLLQWCGGTLCLYSPQPMRTSQKLARFAPNSTLCALSTAGTVLCRGSNLKSLMGNRGINFSSDTLVPVLGAPVASAVTASPDGYFGCAIATATSRVWCWGESLYGAVGNGSFSETVTSPTLTSSTLAFKALVSTLGGNCGLTTAGQAYCWGDGRIGQIGWNGFGWSTAPAAVMGNRVYTQITAGPGHVCALDVGGAAWCWGDNTYGQLGAGRPACTGGPAPSCSTVPVAVQGGLTFRLIAAGVAHTCGVTTGNALYCWGWTNYGRLGLQPLSTEWIAVPTRITP